MTHGTLKKMATLFIVGIMSQPLFAGTFMTDKQLSNLTIDFGVINCWEKKVYSNSVKYIVIDHAGTIYAVNGKARGHAKSAGWKDAESILRKGGDPTVFSDIIQTAIKNGCTQYYGK